MIVIIFIVSVAVFAIAGLVLAAIKTGPSKPVKQRLEAMTWESSRPVHTLENATDIRRAEQISGIEWLNRWLVRINIAPWMRLLLYQADVSARPETLLLIAVVGSGVIAAAVYFRTGAALAAALLSAGFLPVPLLYLFYKRKARFAKFEQQFPGALDMLVSALKVGHSLVAGLGALGQDSTEPMAREFRKLFDEQNFGLDLRSAMANLATRVPLPDVRMFIAAALIQKESGGNLAEVLEKVALTTRERFRLRKQIMIHTAQGRLTGWILSLLPVGLGFGMYLVNPDGMSVLWTRDIGLKMLYTAAAMVAIGWFIIRKIVAIRV